MLLLDAVYRMDTAKLRISMYTVNTADVNKMTKNMHTLNEANYIVANPVDLFYVDTLA